MAAGLCRHEWICQDERSMSERDVQQWALDITPDARCPPRNSTLLHVAAKKGYAAAVCDILSRGADVNAVDVQHWTSLHHAAYQGSVSICTMLIDYHADINVLDSSGLTPLHIAASNGHLETCRTLVNAGANTKAHDTRGWTATVWAQKEGYLDIMWFLKRADYARPMAALLLCMAKRNCMLDQWTCRKIYDLLIGRNWSR